MPSQKPEILFYNYSNIKIPKQFITKTINRIWSYLPKNTINALSIIAVTPLKIKRINSFWRKKNQVTTIITFSEGDIFICPQEIKKRSQKLQIPEKILYQQLLIHSLLHLLGYTHENERERKIMEKLEQELFLKIQNSRK